MDRKTLMEKKEEIDEDYKRLSGRADTLYQSVMTYADYIHEARDYGTGEKIKMVEVHILTMIESQPGVTISALAQMWNRTKSAVSQNVKRLEEKKLVYRVQDESDGKIFHLYPTQEGTYLSLAHKYFDNRDILQTQQDLLELCTMEEIDTFYKVLKAYQGLFNEPA